MLCACGCGKPTKIATKTNRKAGHIKGKPLPSLMGHIGSKSNVAKNTGVSRPQMAKERNPAWSGGADKYWQSQAKIRDNYICQICGFREPEIMEVDHILPKSTHPHLRHSMENLMTLCPNRHRRKTNREKKQILDTLNGKVVPEKVFGKSK